MIDKIISKYSIYIMDRTERIKLIIEAIKTEGESLRVLGVNVIDIDMNENSKFSDASFLDSMNIVELQMILSDMFGDAAKEKVPMLDMTIGEYADMIES